MEKINQKLEAIRAKYCSIDHNDENYYIGGGLDGVRFASRRHEDAKIDEGKLTLGQATQLFKKATGLDTEIVKEVLLYAVPNMEWHHAGKLPKAYGGGMKKTYFLNSQEICNVATNWHDYVEKLAISKEEKRKAAEQQRNIENRRLEFLQVNAKKVERAINKPTYFYLTAREMNGKYGWFDSTYKSYTYNLPEYFSGWEFESEESLQEFYKIQ